MPTIHVAVPVPLRQTFAYHHDASIAPGQRVLVPFGKRTMVGVVVEQPQGPQGTGDLKTIEEVLDEVPCLDAAIRHIAHWLASYYHHPIGEVYASVLPVLLRKSDPLPNDDIAILTVTQNGQTCDIDTLKRSKKQVELLTLLRTGDRDKHLIRESFSAAIIKALETKGLVETTHRKPTIASGAWQASLAVGEKPLPNPEQAVAIAGINARRNEFAPALIEGVTGSGKTEVYLQTIEEVLKQGKQVLILVPEIGLTPQTVSRFEKRFGIEVGLLHSQMNDKARYAVWQRAKNNELGLIIGTRSAIFTPLANPGMLIVDEEHDDSFKQQDGLKYNARDLALVRGRQHKIPVLLGSATPSLETLNNALTGRFTHLELKARAGGAQQTRQHVIDIKDLPLSAGISQPVLGVMRQHLSAGNQVMVFVNRRGYAPALICHHCGDISHCRRCDRPYTVHKAQRRLQCHHCGHTRPMPNRCDNCGSDNLLAQGVGTEQLEEGLARLFPDVKQVRIDSDAVRGKDKLTSMLEAINQQQYQLLIGTQILSKGHHFPHVTLVVVLDCDGALFSGDFRAPEKLAQLVTQLAGRAGRAGKSGDMYLQTHNPGHPLLQDLIHNGYSHFARHALLERKMALLPPYASQVMIRAEAMDGRLAFDFLQSVRQLLPGVNTYSVVGPVPTLLEKKQGRYRFMLVLQAKERADLHRVLATILPAIPKIKLANKVRWAVDVDPTDFS